MGLRIKEWIWAMGWVEKRHQPVNHISLVIKQNKIIRKQVIQKIETKENGLLWQLKVLFYFFVLLKENKI